jgi:hypothetical protein
MTNLEIGREKIPENGWELNPWSQFGEKFNDNYLILYIKQTKILLMTKRKINRFEQSYPLKIHK